MARRVVLDASVIVKWFLQEEGTQEALSLRQDFLEDVIEIYILPLTLLEVANTLRYKPTYDKDTVKKALISLFELDLRIFSKNFELIEKSINIAYDYKITIYDALYIALTLDINGEFITADRELFERTQSLTKIKFLK